MFGISPRPLWELECAVNLPVNPGGLYGPAVQLGVTRVGGFFSKCAQRIRVCVCVIQMNWNLKGLLRTQLCVRAMKSDRFKEGKMCGLSRQPGAESGGGVEEQHFYLLISIACGDDDEADGVNRQINNAVAENCHWEKKWKMMRSNGSGERNHRAVDAASFSVSSSFHSEIVAKTKTETETERRDVKLCIWF